MKWGKNLDYTEIRWKDFLYLLEEVMSRYTEDSEYAVEQFEKELLEWNNITEELLDRIDVTIYKLERDEMTMSEDEKIRTFLK